MKIEQNIISRDWTILYRGRRFFVNFTESDGQTLALCNRDNWEIYEETEGSIEELNSCVFCNSSPAEKEQAQENAEIINKLIRFCVSKWDNNFMQEIRKKIKH